MSRLKGRIQINSSFLFVVCVLMVIAIPISVSLVFLNRVNKGERQVQAAPVAPTVSKCDLNNDLVVDNLDYEIAVSKFGKAYLGSVEKTADIDGDGWVNSLDLEAISANSEICIQ